MLCRIAICTFAESIIFTKMIFIDVNIERIRYFAQGMNASKQNVTSNYDRKDTGTFH